jgi:hypothetical protein
MYRPSPAVRVNDYCHAPIVLDAAAVVRGVPRRATRNESPRANAELHRNSMFCFSPEAPRRCPTTHSGERAAACRAYTPKELTMTIKRRHLAPTLLAVAAAASIVSAPSALAEQSCTSLSANSTVCQSPGNAQIVSSPPPVQYAPQYPFFGNNVIILHHRR